jgi:hypothetical protein
MKAQLAQRRLRRIRRSCRGDPASMPIDPVKVWDETAALFQASGPDPYPAPEH